MVNASTSGPGAYYLLSAHRSYKLLKISMTDDCVLIPLVRLKDEQRSSSTQGGLTNLAHLFLSMP